MAALGQNGEESYQRIERAVTFRNNIVRFHGYATFAGLLNSAQEIARREYIDPITGRRVTRCIYIIPSPMRQRWHVVVEADNLREAVLLPLERIAWRSLDMGLGFPSWLEAFKGAVNYIKANSSLGYKISATHTDWARKANVSIL